MQEWDTQRTRDNMQTGDVRYATDNSRLATQNMYQTRCDVGQATDSTHRGALGQATETRPQTTRSKPDPTDSNAADDKQGATCKAPLENVQQKIDDMQHAMGNMQQTTYSVQ